MQMLWGDQRLSDISGHYPRFAHFACCRSQMLTECSVISGHTVKHRTFFADQLSAVGFRYCHYLLLSVGNYKSVATGLPVWMLRFGMDVIRLKQRLIQLTNSLFQEGFLDEQFTQLQHLQDDNDPDFVTEVISLFFDDSEKLLDKLANELDNEAIDYKKIDAHVHQFKGSSSSVGAPRVKNVCIAFRAFCNDNDRAGCLQCLQQLREEYYLFKNKLQHLFHLEQQILSAGGTLPVME